MYYSWQNVKTDAESISFVSRVSKCINEEGCQGAGFKVDLPTVHGKWYLWIKVVDYLGNEIIVMDPREYVIDNENPVLTGFDIMGYEDDKYLKTGDEITVIASFSEVIHYMHDE